jgi:putative nucleotidyltransferase with HDIG domain
MAASARVLVVDDLLGVREVLKGGLEAAGHQVATASSAEEAKSLFGAGGRFDLVVCDIQMPGESGVELLSWMKSQDADVAVVMVTGVDDATTAVAAMLKGAADYLTKPFTLPEVRARAEQALDKRRLQLENRAYQDRLERLVDERTREVVEAMRKISDLNAELRVAYDATLRSLMIALDYRDNETQGHSIRVVEFTERLAVEMGVQEPALTHIRRGAMLHDVGKIGIPDAILKKPGKLDAEEWEYMKAHARLGYDMLRDIAFLETAAQIVLTHQEKWDGTGYPQGLKAEQIPLGSRIFAVADTFDAMTSDRPYRNALPYEKAREELLLFAGSQFDPAVVGAFLSVPREEWYAIRRRVQSELSERTSGGIPDSLLTRVAVTDLTTTSSK